jgi:hypothetical protein
MSRKIFKDSTMSYVVNIINETPDGDQTFSVKMDKGTCNPESGKIPAMGTVTLKVDDDNATGTITFSYGNVQVPLQQKMSPKDYTEQTLRVNTTPTQEGVEKRGGEENTVKVTRP